MTQSASNNLSTATGKVEEGQAFLYRASGQTIDLRGIYNGRSAFLLGSGPSLRCVDTNALTQRGVLTCAMNNAAALYRPHLWTSLDSPGNFVDAIWRDPAILKFIPLENMGLPIVVRDADGHLNESRELASEMPNVLGFLQNEAFNAECWLSEKTFCCGNCSNLADVDGNRGVRSVILFAIKLLYLLGIRRVYLLGCDFRMRLGSDNYAFPQDRSIASIRKNNHTYLVVNRRFWHLKPHFDRVGFEVFNCNPNSGLNAFPFLSFEQALKESLSEMPTTISTEGMYDRKARERLLGNGG